MRPFTVVAAWLTALLCGCTGEDNPREQSAGPAEASGDATKPTGDPEDGAGELGDYVDFPASGVRIRKPEGLDRADSFDGFGDGKTLSSVMAVSMRAPYSEATAGFTSGRMKARGMTLLSKEEMDVDGVPATLVHFKQSAAGRTFLKWALIFGDAGRTVIVTATFPEELEGDLSARLKAAVLSTRKSRSPPTDPRVAIPFTLEPSPKLKLTPAMTRMLLFTKDGVIPVKSPGDPMFVAGPAIGPAATGDQKGFAERRLHQTARTKGLVVRSTEAITIDGLDGYESLAEAREAESGTPLIVYQVMLFDAESYILMQGLVGAESRDEYLPAFREMARSLRRK